MVSSSTQKVRGRRSPRWAVWARMSIPCKGGLLYLVRLRIIATPWFGIYVHDIHEDDGDRDCHNHPWSFISIVLRGSYTERVYDQPASHPCSYRQQVHGRFSVHRMGRTSAHRIVKASPGLKTLILVGPRRGTWGFFEHDGTFVDWETYEKKIGTI